MTRGRRVVPLRSGLTFCHIGEKGIDSWQWVVAVVVVAGVVYKPCSDKKSFVAVAAVAVGRVMPVPTLLLLRLRRKVQISCCQVFLCMTLFCNVQLISS